MVVCVCSWTDALVEGGIHLFVMEHGSGENSSLVLLSSSAFLVYVCCSLGMFVSPRFSS